MNTANAIVEHGQLTAFNGLNALCNPRTKVAYEVTDVLNIVYHWKIMNVSLSLFGRLHLVSIITCSDGNVHVIYYCDDSSYLVNVYLLVEP